MNIRIAGVLLALAAVSTPNLWTNGVAIADPNAFNRLLPQQAKRNPPPAEDGIHDPADASTALLQAPRESFAPFPKAPSGNYVNWVRTLEEAKIQPRYDRLDAKAGPVVMDLNIVREVKGSMPDVVYPHKQHTEWLDCSNCHPAIFIPQKGANQMSMAGILMGEQCGVCHGKVAFPVSECTRCHSKPKGQPQAGSPAHASPAEATPAGAGTIAPGSVASPGAPPPAKPAKARP